MMSVLFDVHRLCEPLPKISGVIAESASTDLLICARDPLPPWMTVRPSAVLLGVDRIEGNEEAAKKASCAMYIIFQKRWNCRRYCCFTALMIRLFPWKTADSCMKN